MDVAALTHGQNQQQVPEQQAARSAASCIAEACGFVTLPDTFRLISPQVHEGGVQVWLRKAPGRLVGNRAGACEHEHCCCSMQDRVLLVLGGWTGAGS